MRQENKLIAASLWLWSLLSTDTEYQMNFARFSFGFILKFCMWSMDKFNYTTARGLAVWACIINIAGLKGSISQNQQRPSPTLIPLLTEPGSPISTSQRSTPARWYGRVIEVNNFRLLMWLHQSLVWRHFLSQKARKRLKLLPKFSLFFKSCEWFCCRVTRSCLW